MNAPELEFEVPTHHKGVNLTVRRGLKWYGRNVAYVAGVGNVMLAHRVLPFDALTTKDLALEHDPECRSLTGLYAVMRKVYPDFEWTEVVTLVYYEA